MKKLNYEETEQEKQKVAEILEDDGHLTGLEKLTKTQLIIVINSILEPLDRIANVGQQDDERDAFDILYDKYCLVLDCLNGEEIEIQGEEI